MPFIPHTETDIQEMLAAIGVSSIEALFDEIPPNLRGAFQDILPGLTEMELGAFNAATRRRSNRFTFYWYRSLQASYSCRRVGYRRAVVGLRALAPYQAGSQPEQAATCQRISNDDGASHWHGGF